MRGFNFGILINYRWTPGPRVQGERRSGVLEIRKIH
jgi:hypothetical protein